jgi:hypothetical protein
MSWLPLDQLSFGFFVRQIPNLFAKYFNDLTGDPSPMTWQSEHAVIVAFATAFAGIHVVSPNHRRSSSVSSRHHRRKGETKDAGTSSNTNSSIINGKIGLLRRRIMASIVNVYFQHAYTAAGSANNDVAVDFRRAYNILQMIHMMYDLLGYTSGVHIRDELSLIWPALYQCLHIHWPLISSGVAPWPTVLQLRANIYRFITHIITLSMKRQKTGIHHDFVFGECRPPSNTATTGAPAGSILIEVLVTQIERDLVGVICDQTYDRPPTVNDATLDALYTRIPYDHSLSRDRVVEQVPNLLATSIASSSNPRGRDEYLPGGAHCTAQPFDITIELFDTILNLLSALHSTYVNEPQRPSSSAAIGANHSIKPSNSSINIQQIDPFVPYHPARHMILPLVTRIHALLRGRLQRILALTRLGSRRTNTLIDPSSSSSSPPAATSVEVTDTPSINVFGLYPGTDPLTERCCASWNRWLPRLGAVAVHTYALWPHVAPSTPTANTSLLFIDAMPLL